MNPSGIPAQALSSIVKDHQSTLILSEPIVDELKRVLFYPKVRHRINLQDDEINLWLTSLQLISHFVISRFSYPILIQEDPDDNRYLIAAMEGRADTLMSGDKHLLNLREYRSVRIITAADFLNQTRIGNNESNLHQSKNEC